MVFSELMKSASVMFNNWINDKTLDGYYCGDKEALQKEFIACIQDAIGSEFVVLTVAEFNTSMKEEHPNEGFDMDVVLEGL